MNHKPKANACCTVPSGCSQVKQQARNHHYYMYIYIYMRVVSAISWCKFDMFLFVGSLFCFGFVWFCVWAGDPQLQRMTSIGPWPMALILRICGWPLGLCVLSSAGLLFLAPTYLVIALCALHCIWCCNYLERLINNVPLNACTLPYVGQVGRFSQPSSSWVHSHRPCFYE